MAQRRFIDADGVVWEVYDVVADGHVLEVLKPMRPVLAADAAVSRRFTTWLCFESATEKRRLGPIPLGWADAPQDELRRLLALADPVKPRP